MHVEHILSFTRIVMVPSRSRRLRLFLLLSGCAALTNAISLSDFSPRTDGLDPQCEKAYTTQIPGCTTSDFSAGKTCSNNCVNGLVQINNLVATDCQNADVPETSIIGLFKMGQGIQVLCNVAVVTSSSAQGGSGGLSVSPSSKSVSIGKSTMVLTSSAAATSSSLLLDTSSATLSQTAIIGSSTAVVSPGKSSSAKGTLATAGNSSSSSKATSSSSTSKTSSTGTKTSSATANAESVKSGNTDSGGGSPIDNINNSGALGTYTAWSLSSLSTAVTFGFWLVLR